MARIKLNRPGAPSNVHIVTGAPIVRPILKGLAVGDSTVAAYLGQTALADFLFTSEEDALGYVCDNIAVPGHTISQQNTAWNSYGSKTTPDIIFIQVGLNNLVPATPVATEISLYQSLINNINSGKKSGCKTVLATMVPCKARLNNLYGANGPVAYQKWLDLNAAITNTILGADEVVTSHTDSLNDGNGNLAAVYDTGDGIHTNNAGRRINAAAWKVALNNLFL